MSSLQPNQIRWQSLGPFLLAGVAMSCVTTVQPGGVQSQPGTTTTILVIRHAERDPGLDPPLNAVGQARAEALKAVLAENGVTAIYCTDLLRNRQTVQPLADALGLGLNLVSPVFFTNTATAGQQIVDDIIANHAGGTVLWCGNTGQTVVEGVDIPGVNEQIYRYLGGTGEPPNRYQDFYVAIVPDSGPPRFIKTTYGGPSPQD